MLKVGLTGGIACGKTTILAMFAELGAHTLRADVVAHRLMVPGEAMFDETVAAFGQEVLALDGTISRPKLAAAAFPDRIKELNAIVHPRVLAFEDDWMNTIAKTDPKGVAICEAALLIEAGGLARYDKLIVVTCTLEQKVQRFAERTATTPEEARAEVLKRMAAQMSEAEKARLADFVIDNSAAKDAAEQRVREVWKELTTAARR